MPSDLPLDPDTEFSARRQLLIAEEGLAEQIWAEQSQSERSRAERRRDRQMAIQQRRAERRHEQPEGEQISRGLGGRWLIAQFQTRQLKTRQRRDEQLRREQHDAVARPAVPVVKSARRRRHGLVAMALSLAVVGSAVLSVSSATAAPKPTVKEVEKKVKKLQDQAEQASEQYNETKVQLKSLDVRMKATKAQLDRQNVELAKSRTQLGKLASETYRRGELSTLDLLLGDDPDLALAQAGYLPMLSDRQADATNRLRLGEEKLASTQAALKSQQARAKAAQAKLSATKKTVNKKLSEAEAQVNSLKASQQAALARDQSSSASAGVPAGAGLEFCNAKADSAPSAKARTAIRYACSKLGSPYQWAASGPSRFDCSGLTMKAYEAAGVSLPHSSRLQAGYGTRVSVSSLEAGDLVFFHSPISHVGIYIGGGLMVHAPQSGDVVRIASLYETPTAAVRF